MTKEEIIEECKQRLGFETDYEMYSLCQHEKDFYNAIIKALEQQPSEDCVSRQAVLNTLFYKSDNNCEVVLNKELQDSIKALPPVTPKIPTSNDCVSMSELKNILSKLEPKCKKYGIDSIYDEALWDFTDELRALKPATPTRKKGKWKAIDDTHSQCMECGAIFCITSNNEGEVNYCPNCSAKMIGDNDGREDN